MTIARLSRRSKIRIYLPRSAQVVCGTVRRFLWRGDTGAILICPLRLGYSAVVMNNRTGKLLLMIAVLALVTAPVHAAFALNAMPCADEAAHCAGMHHGMRIDLRASETGGHTVDGKGHCAGHGCDGTCCNGACGHAPVALTGAFGRVSDAVADDLHVEVIHRFAGRTIPPLFRPPISLLS